VLQGDRTPAAPVDLAVAWAERTAFYLPQKAAHDNPLSPTYAHAHYSSGDRWVGVFLHASLRVRVCVCLHACMYVVPTRAYMRRCVRACVCVNADMLARACVRVRKSTYMLCGWLRSIDCCAWGGGGRVRLNIGERVYLSVYKPRVCVVCVRVCVCVYHPF